MNSEDDRLVDEVHKVVCEHNSFRAAVTVNRISDTNPMRFATEISVVCAECGMAFEFIGLPCGLSSDFPTVNPTAQELRCPIRPKSKYVLPGMLGDKVMIH